MSEEENSEVAQTPVSPTVQIQEEAAANKFYVDTSPTVTVVDAPNAVVDAPEVSHETPGEEEIQSAEDMKWYYADGVEGAGNKPEWFNDKTFKTLAEQAKAHGELRKKLASFTGAPKEGYEVELGEQFEGVELKEDDPMLNQFSDIAQEMNMSQDGFNNVLNFYLGETQKVAEEAEQEAQTYWEGELEKLGPNGTEELKLLQQWSRNALPEDLQESFHNLVTDANTVKIFQKLIDQTVPTQLTHVAPGTGIDRIQLQEMMKDPRYQVDVDYQRHVDAEAGMLYGSKKIFD